LESPFEEEYLMETSKIVAELDAEIARLQGVRALLVGDGRKASARKKRVLSAEARAKISAAQKKRWAKQKKAAK
jgi:hypothetical protein